MNTKVKKELDEILEDYNVTDITHWSNHNWSEICWIYTLSEDFIREFQNEVHWHNISWQQTLSEKFIIEFKDYIDWEGISRNQELSKSFIQKFWDQLDIEGLVERGLVKIKYKIIGC